MEENDVIEIVQLPIIEARLNQIMTEINTKIEAVLALDCSPETCKVIKKERAELNKMYQDMENRRKEVKKKILEPYKQFESIYNKCVGNSFEAADKVLNERITAVEDTIKKAKEQEAKGYFNEYRESIGLSEDDAPYESAEIRVTLTASIKSLKESAKKYLDKVLEDIKAIRCQPYADEIMVEYRGFRNVAYAITVVEKRHREIETEQKRVARETPTNESTEDITAPKGLQSPIVSDDEEDGEIYNTTFTVHATMAKLRELKNFLENGGYDYE